MAAMNKSLGFVSSGLKGNVRGVKNANSTFTITYSPTITMPSGASKDDFSNLLKQHKDEVVAIIKRELERKERLAY